MSRRTDRLSRAIREVVSSSILFDLRDPRVKNVTVLDVDVAGDLRSAKVRVSVLGDERTANRALHGLESSRGYLQSKIGDRVELRYTPVLSFEIDDSVKKSIEASRILREIEEREGPFGVDAERADAGSGDASESVREADEPEDVEGNDVEGNNGLSDDAIDPVSGESTVQDSSDTPGTINKHDSD